MSAFLHKNDIINHWTDIRDIIRTDDSYRNAKINWNDTMRLACKNLKRDYLLFDINTKS